MNRILPIAGAAALAALAVILLRPQAGPAPQGAAATAGGALVQVSLPDSLLPEARIGESAFAAKCATCHGQNAAGRDGIAPPLVHRIYEPSHHGDESFQLAVLRGVRAHHWTFGDMPPVDGLTRADVAGIVAYVRALQRANGID
ncbi:c-type cytochrome [Thetidibacter halocola]|uniref:Cytochrome c n=1 Tax=Thetidibacter halocola TaxID=2827239 RepID=A0A8J7WKC3_9RHOB|nr:cytochrome c [Thetidibacter halocola]MBS0126609.1 cytochrome c [Thetidibacter halocola]